jgi:AcrR family transcriptional regulator
MDASTSPFFVSPDDPPAKQELLKAALALFVRDGLCETSIRAIAAQAGFTNPALFKHFEGKDALALHLFEQCYRRLSGELSGAVRPNVGFFQNLRAVLERYARLLEESPEAILFVQDNLRRFWPGVSPAVRRLSIIGLIRRLVEAGLREGVVAADVSVDLMVAGLVGLLAQFAREHHFGELAGTPEAWVEELDRLASRMVRAA